MLVCPHCAAPFSSGLALRGHSRVHAQTFASATAKMAETNYAAAEQRYLASPQVCRTCSTAIPYANFRNNRGVIFCSRKCAATRNNQDRGARTAATKEAISLALRQRHATSRQPQIRVKTSQRPRPVLEKDGPHSKVYSNTCLLCAAKFLTRHPVKYCVAHVHHYPALRSQAKALARFASGPFSWVAPYSCSHCKLTFLSRTKRKYCQSHAALYGDEGRNLYEFTFNVFLYPDLFSQVDLELVSQLGFWSPKNTSGITRDHRVSVNEAVRNGYPPYYIKHPLNCKLMPWHENNRKKTASSLEFSELVRLVDAYEAAVRR